MSLELETCPTLWARSPRPDISSLRAELVNIREELLSEIAHSSCEHSKAGHAYHASEDVMVLRVLTKLRPLEQALNNLPHKTSEVCGHCRKAISVSQLILRPESTLCASCIDERLNILSADAL